MEYKYENIINDLNLGNIRKIDFSIKNYNHYKNCSISRFLHEDSAHRKRVEVKLTQDNSETVCFYDKLPEDYKLFRFGRKGSFTLKQVWGIVEIRNIVYYDPRQKSMDEEMF